ncbi:MAG: VCBS repeat-containing protein [Actinomycetota bacterium]
MRRTSIALAFACTMVGLVPAGRALAEPPAGGVAVDGSVSIPLGYQRDPLDLVVVDTDVDGRNDVVATIWSQSDGPQLQIFRQDSAGGLASERIVTLTGAPTNNGGTALAVADMDGDGDLDVVVGLFDHIEIWASSPAGLSKVSSRSLADGVLDLWAADADLDGRTDLLVGSLDVSDVARATLLHQGSGGGFTATTAYQGASLPRGFDDATGDGRPDVEVSGEDGAGIAKQKLDGSFLPPVAGPPTSGVAKVGEFTGDARADIVQWSWQEGRWEILAGKPDGTLAAPVLLALDVFAFGAWTVADLDGDGLDDLVLNAGNGVFGTMLVSYQRDDGSFTAVCDYVIGVSDSLYFDVMTIGDVNDDGRPDILTANYSLDIARQIPSANAVVDILSTRRTFYVDEPVALVGSFGFDIFDGGCRLDQPIHVRRTGTAGGAVDLGVVRTDFPDIWSFTESAPLPEGAYTYELSWAGDAIRDPVSDSVQITVAKRRSSWELEVPYELRYGSDAPWTFVLGAYQDTDVLSVDVSTRRGGVEQPLGTFPIDPATGAATGVLTDLDENTTMIIRWAGDDVYQPVEVIRKIGVEPIVKGRMLRDDGMDGAVHLYRADRRVFYRTTVVPNLSGSPIRIVVEHKVGSRWHDLVSQRFDLGPYSSLTIYLQARYLVVGDTYHIDATFLRNERFVTTSTPWSLFRVIRADRAVARERGASSSMVSLRAVPSPSRRVG